KQTGGRALQGDGSLIARTREVLPFNLTGDQDEAIRTIRADMSKPAPMLRLLQGDVGSGKTVVAFMAMLAAIEAGTQAVLMAPTEALAHQHAATLGPLADSLGIGWRLITGKMPAADRKASEREIESGTARLILGTHALFTARLSYSDPGLIVIDEQHRFGVHQRLALTGKGADADMLVLSATPIPRSLAMALYGDMDISSLTEKPPGKRPVETKAIPMDRLETVITRLAPRIQAGERVFWVCPAVVSSDSHDLMSVTQRAEALEARFPGQVAAAHGQMHTDARTAAMESFVKGRQPILVATTVIEVGIDIPEATIMIIEHADNFGLAQLHQLRGRTGRGDKPGACVLLYDPPLTETARKRLSILRETDDGFKIAEMDLALRGPGDPTGPRQSGLPDFRLADIGRHAALVAIAQSDARAVLTTENARGQALDVLAYLFDQSAPTGAIAG
ncbi:MAG: ATP-dependent DNA helicase RecG, partial [Pseudomonadota bacterium]|nr:ATP-dependent DNA helicase RecG [Pseudomonadota bacterium]